MPGGSSGGSAAAVAGGLAPCAIGTDTGGSIRQPAALCGIVGLKPTYGAISRYGMIAFASSLDQCGPLTRDVADAALLLAAMAGRDPLRLDLGRDRGRRSRLPGREDLAGPALRGADGARRGDAIEAGVRAVVRGDARRGSRSSAARSPRSSLPHAEHGISAYYVVAPAEASSNLARYDGVRYGLRVAAPSDLIEMYEATRAEGFGAEVKRRIMLGTYALSSGYYDAYYGQAQKVRTLIADDFDAAFDDVDFVVTPTSPTVAFELGEKTDDPLAMYLNDFFTVPMTLAGIPAISIPAGLAEPEGGGPELPVGFQIAAPAFAEQKLLEAAYALETAIGFDARPEGRWRERVAELEAVIGLEIHVQLATRTKMFCGCALSFGDEPNVHTCPVCLAHPGVLPVPNEEAIRYALKIGRGARLRGRAALDLPPQELLLSRQPEGLPDQPVRHPDLLGDGRLGDVRIHRAHLEEDAAKMIHVGESGRIHGSGASLVDFNRGGTPLVEIVTEPDLRSRRRGGAPGRGCCARRCASSASPTSTWRRAACGSTPTSRCARPAARSWGPRPS